MSHTTSLKKDIADRQLILKTDAIALAELEVKVQEQKRELNKLQRALAILEDKDLPEPEPTTQEVARKQVRGDASAPFGGNPSPVAEAPTIPSPKPKPQHPECSACSGPMYPHVTKAPSGVLIQHLRCDDCGNEAY